MCYLCSDGDFPSFLYTMDRTEAVFHLSLRAHAYSHTH